MKTKHHQNTIYRRWFRAGLGALFFASLTALLPFPVQAQCEQWDVSGDWEIVQSNGNRVQMVLSVNDTVVTGYARDVQDAPRIPVTGTMVGNKFNVTVYWKGGNVGVYRGTVDAGGGMKGTARDKASGARATWYSNRSMMCAPADAAPPTTQTNPIPKPVKKSGHMPTPAPVVRPVKSSGRPKTSPATPTIKANPIVLTIPAGQSHGTITLTWDGGPDHPEAEVWMKAHTQGGEETLVVRQGKGTRSMAVQGGINYAFALKDAGEVLARTAVLTRQ